MPTVFERIGSALTGNDATVRVDAQVGNLLSVGSFLEALSSSPPAEVANLERVFGEISLPDFAAPASFVARIGEIRAAVPTDASGVLGGVLGQIGDVESEFAGALAAALGNALVAFEKVQALSRVRFSCEEEETSPGGGAGGGGNGNGGGGGGGGNGGAPPPADQPTAIAAATEEANVSLDRFPTPLTVRSLLTWLHDVTTFRRNNPLFPAVLPVFDDLRDPLDTLVVWEALTPAQVRTQIEAALTDAGTFVRTGVESTVAPLLADLAALTAAVPAGDLERIAQRLTVRLGELRTAVQSGTLAGTGAAVSEINALLDEYDVLRPTLILTIAPAPALRARLLELPGDLDVGMAGMISILRPGGAVLSHVPTPVEGALDTLETWLLGIADWLHDLANSLDLSVIQGPITDIADGAQAVADGLQQAIIAVTLQVQALFGQLEALLDAIDPAALQAEAEAAVQTFRNSVVTRIDAAVGPARAAVLTAVDAIDQAVEAFDPGQILDALTDAVNALADVLQEGEVADAIAAIRGVLEDAARTLEALQFTPVTDAVVGSIDGLTGALRAIDPALIPGPAAEALQSAASVLPADLEVVTTPILDEFGELVDSGPVPILEQVRAAPAQLLETVRNFDPAALIGEQLTAPFQEVVRALEQFVPSELLEPVATELESLKQRLRDTASPGQAVRALEAPFAELRAAFDGFDPSTIVQPIDDALSAAMDRLIAVLPVDETFAVVDDAVSAVRRVIDTANGVVALIGRVRAMAGGLLDARAQLEAWVDEVLDKVDAIGDTSGLQPALDALRAALDATRADAIADRFAEGTAAARAALDQVRGTDRLAALIDAHRAVPRAALAALPASAQKTALEGALNRFDPLLPEFGAPWHQLGQLRQSLTAADTELQTLLGVWDDRFHVQGSSLSLLRQAQASPAQFRAWAQETLEAQFIEPAVAVFGVLDPVRRVLDGFLVRLEDLVGVLTDKLNALLLGPGSIGGIRTALGQVVDQLLDLDLDFLSDSLRSLFDNVKAKLDNVSPERLRAALDASFAAVLDTITLDLILPPALLAQLDSTYGAVVDRLRALDPSTIVEEVVQPLFDDTILPLLEQFDLSPVLNTIIEKLAGLDDELKAELARVNTSYRALLAALPSGGTQGASVSVGVG